MVRPLRNIASITLYTVGVVLAIVIASIILLSKPIPEGEEGPKAEALADSILAAVNEPAWESLRYLRWTFDGKRGYVWDRWYNLAEITWDDNRVLISLSTLQGKAWVSGNQLFEEHKRKKLQKAWEYWCNDSFWLNPAVKIRDEGTKRKYVELQDGSRGLLVEFTSGGVTPGDTYLMIPGEDNMPVKLMMWVSIWPIKGVEVSFSDWMDVDGAKIALNRQVGPIDITISDIRSGDHHSEIGLEKDPFTDF